MFTAYVDASKNARDQRFWIVSGYIANVLQWKCFESIWLGLHEEYGVDLPFQIADFHAAMTRPQYKSQKNARRDYAKLTRNKHRAGQFFDGLSTAEATTMACGVSCFVDTEIYNGLSSRIDLRKAIPPCVLGARTCLTAIHAWEKEFSIGQPTECIFEEGSFEKGKFTHLIVSEGEANPLYKKKNDCAALQAAEHYAWEQFFHLKTQLRGSASEPRDAFRLLVQAIPKIHLRATREDLIGLCRTKGIDPLSGIRIDE